MHGWGGAWTQNLFSYFVLFRLGQDWMGCTMSGRAGTADLVAYRGSEASEEKDGAGNMAMEESFCLPSVPVTRV